jgi:hypothetical protein
MGRRPGALYDQRATLWPFVKDDGAMIVLQPSVSDQALGWRPGRRRRGGRGGRDHQEAVRRGPRGDGRDGAYTPQPVPPVVKLS